MIRVTMHTSSGSIRGLRVTGHGSGKRGSDIVCSAVSAVSQTALRGLIHFGAREVRWQSENGFLTAVVDERTPPEKTALLDAILTTAWLGLREIADQYPDRVTVELVEAPARR